MKRNKNLKNIIAVGLCIFIAFCFCGCNKNYEKIYGDYIKSLISINYLGPNEDSVKAAGADEEEAKTLYNKNVEMLANNIQTYYGVVITDAPELQEEYEELAKQIYSKINYSIDKVYKGTESYYVDVTIYPIDLFSQTAPQVQNYVDTFNTAVANGDYNEYTLSEYEMIFSRGLIDILFEGSLVMTYAAPIKVTVQIIEDGNTFYISDNDFLSIDKAMFKSTITYETSTPTDAQ